MNNILAPSNQIIYNTPLYQSTLKNDPKFGDATNHPPDGSDPSVYLTRLLNLTLRSFGEDCVIKGSKVHFNKSGIGSITAEFKINSGIFIKDSTLLELTEEVTVDHGTDLDYDHFVISVHYDFSENVEDNPIEIHCTLWNESTEKVDGLAGGLILGLFKYELSGSVLTKIEDVTYDLNTGIPKSDITMRNVNGDIIGTAKVKPVPMCVRNMFDNLLKSRDLHPNDILFSEQTGINGEAFQTGLYYVLSLPLYDRIEPYNTILSEYGFFD